MFFGSNTYNLKKYVPLHSLIVDYIIVVAVMIITVYCHVCSLLMFCTHTK